MRCAKAVVAILKQDMETAHCAEVDGAEEVLEGVVHFARAHCDSSYCMSDMELGGQCCEDELLRRLDCSWPALHDH